MDTEEPALWPRAEVAPVSLGELKTVLHKMKNGKAADATGMRVEFIKMLDEADLIQWLDAASRTLKIIGTRGLRITTWSFYGFEARSEGR